MNKLFLVLAISLLFIQNCATPKTSTPGQSQSNNSLQSMQPSNKGPGANERELNARRYTAVRLEYAASKTYNPYASGVSEAIKKSDDLLQEEKFQETIEEAAKGLALDRLNIQLLMVQAASYRQLGEIEKANELRKKWMGLVDSVLASGDGKSFATAFHVISVDEEYALMTLLKLRLTQQSLVEHNGSQYDLMDVLSSETGNESRLYFNIDIPKGWLDKNIHRLK